MLYDYAPPDVFINGGDPLQSLPAQEIFNVVDYGAVADQPVDSTTAIQDAIVAANAAGGGVVYLPPGTYGISASDFYPGKSGSIYLLDNVFLMGAGLGQSTLRLVDGSADEITGLVRTDPSTGTLNYGMADFTLDGNRANTSNTVIGVLTGVKEQNGNGIPDQDVYMLRMEVQNNSSYGFDPHEQTHRLLVKDSVAHDNGKDGFVADYLVDSDFVNNVAYDNDRHGFNVTTTTNDFRMTDNIAHNNGATGVVLQRGNFDIPIVHDITITGGEYYGNAKEGILVRMSDNVTVDNVDVHDNGTYGVRFKGSTNSVLTNSVVANNSQNQTDTYSNIQIRDELDPLTGEMFSGENIQIRGNTVEATGAVLPRYGIEERAGSVDFNLITADNSFIGTHVRGEVKITGANSVWEDNGATEGNDILIGTSLDDTIDGFGGNDDISGKKGDDIVNGGSGNDDITADTGADLVYGGDGDDFIRGKDGDDILLGDAGNDQIDGGKNNDRLDGGAGNDNLNGGSGDDVLIYTVAENAGADDFYDGALGADTLRLRVTLAEQAALQAEIDAFQASLANADPASKLGTTFKFSSINLDAKNFEAIEIEIVDDTIV